MSKMEQAPPSPVFLKDSPVGKSSGEIKRKGLLGRIKSQKSELAENIPQPDIKKLSVKKHKNPTISESDTKEVVVGKPMKQVLIEELKANIFVQHLILIPLLIIASMIFGGIFVWTIFIIVMIYL